MKEKVYYKLLSNSGVLTVQIDIKQQQLNKLLLNWQNKFIQIEQTFKSIQETILDLKQPSNKTTKDNISNIQKSLRIVSQQQKILNKIKLYGIKIRENINKLIENTQKIIDKVNLDQINNKPEELILNIDKILKTNTENMDKLKSCSNNLEKTFINLNELLTKLDDIHHQLDQLNLPSSVSLLTSQVNKLTDNFNNISFNIQQNPNLITQNTNNFLPLQNAIKKLNLQMQSFYSSNQLDDNKLIEQSLELPKNQI